ncbi:MAG: saccharopine dehydrogenase NADP-binding domain-containing protein [Candidatus Marinimicrobia bacterium]|nr:saccharopine dehydrogenase NADP-binding domain-containing protein [Candidatus Neomarinimicrobiota bacterium]
MEPKTILLLGGYGLAGRQIAGYLLRETSVYLIVSGRSREHATAFRNQLNNDFSGDRVAAIAVDAADGESLKRALDGVDLLVVASSTAQYAGTVARAALDTATDYMDIQYSNKRLAVLRGLADEIQQSGHTFITEGGFHPGVPAALVRYAAQKIDGLSKAVVSCALKVNWKDHRAGDATTMEFAEELIDYEALYYRGGQWHKARMWSTRDFLHKDYGEPYGKQLAVPMLLEEMRALPEAIPTLRETGFYITGFNWLTDWLVMPLAMLLVKLGPRRFLRAAGRLIFWSLEIMSAPPFGIVLELDGGNESKTIEIRIQHEDGYVLTAVPTVACIKQYLAGQLESGLHLMAHAVDPVQYLDDMASMGITVETKIQN